MEDKENEEFRKRIRELVKNVEKKDPNSQYTEQDLKEARERLIQTVKRRTQEEKYRDEKLIVLSTLWIQSLYKHEIEDQHRDEIDTFYEIIFEQLKKPAMYIPNLDPTKPNPLDFADKKRILRNMENVLGKEKVDFFKKKYNLSNWFLTINSTQRSEQWDLNSRSYPFPFGDLRLKILKKIEEERKAQQRFDTTMGLIIGIPSIIGLILLFIWACFSIIGIGVVVIVFLILGILAVTEKRWK